MYSREPALNASFTMLSRTRVDTPARGAHGDRTVTNPLMSVTLVSFTVDPHPGSVSPGARGGVAGHRIR